MAIRSFTLLGAAGFVASVAIPTHAIAAEHMSLTETAANAMTLDSAEVYQQPAADPNAPAAPAPPADPESFFRGWKGSLEGGLAGSSGNTEKFGARIALGLKRETSKMVTTFGAGYIYSADDGDKSESRGEIFGRNDWKLGESKWRVYAIGKGEYDEFQDWDWRVSAFVGVGYELIKTDSTLFIPRVGVGISKEIGGSENKIVPEADLGWDFEHKFNENVKFFNIFDFYPALDEFGPYRFETKAGLEVLLSKENNLSLKLGINDRYDSTPNGKKRNDIDYFATIVWTF